MENFRTKVQAYRQAPTADMVERLTELVMRMPDLREKDQEECFRQIEELAQKWNQEQESRVKERTTMDDSTMRLVEMITGKSTTATRAAVAPASAAKAKDSALSSHEAQQLIQRCLAALATGDEDILRQSMLRLLALAGIAPLEFGLPAQDDPDDGITFEHLRRLLKERLHGVPKFSRKATDEQLSVLSQVFSPAARPRNLVLQDAFEITSVPDAAFPQASNGGSNDTRLLCHCTRSRGNVFSILQGGLQVRGTGGRLGAAIYLADTVEKSLQYTFKETLQDGRDYAVVFVVEAALGRMYETATNMMELTAPPTGYDSVFANFKGAVQDQAATAAQVHGITFADGTKAMLTTMNPSSIGHNEYTVYTPSRVRLRFLLMFAHSSSAAAAAAVPALRAMPRGRVAPPPPLLPEVIDLTGDADDGSAAAAPAASAASKPDNDLFGARQRQNSFRAKLVRRIQRTAVEFGAESPEVKRARTILEQVSADASSEVFLRTMDF